MARDEISLIVCTYNRAEMLQTALRSLVLLETDGGISYEIVVVDDQSTDHTATVVEEIQKRSKVRILYLKGEGKGIAAARNSGINASTYPWIAFFDDDQLADQAWLKNFMNAAHDTNAFYMAGRRLLKALEDELPPLSPVCRKILGEVDFGDQRLQCTRNMIPTAGNMMLARELVDRVGLFSETLTEGGEEVDLFRRVQNSGYEAWYVPNALVYHLIPAYRQRVDYLIWTSLRNGDNFAYRDFKEWGPSKMGFVCALRIGQALTINFPHLLVAFLSGNQADVIGYKCLLWRAVGYFRRSCFTIFPWFFNEESFKARLEFRSERALFGKK